MSEHPSTSVGQPAVSRTDLLFAVFNARHAHCAVLDRSGTIIEVNEAWRRFARENHGSRDTFYIGANYLDVCKRVTDETCDTFALDAYCGVHDVLTGDKKEFHLEYPCDGPLEKRWFVMDVLPLADDIGGAIVSHENITVRKQLEELERSNAALDAFTYTASHGLREPLRGIRNHVQFILEGDLTGQSPQTLQSLGAIQRLSRHLDGLVEGLMRFAQVGQAIPDVRPVSIGEIAHFAVEAVCGGTNDPSIEVTIDTTMPVVLCDPILVGEVLQNLIANAVKYRSAGPCRISVGWDGNAAHPEFFVADNGIGIQEEDQSSVFQLFRRLHPHGAHGGGAGVGLTIVKRIVESHGGRIRLSSLPGQRTTFAFTLAPPHSAS